MEVLLPAMCTCAFILTVGGEISPDGVLLVTEDGELVADGGSNFTLTCSGDSPFQWHYPQTEYDNKSEIIGDQQSTLTVRSASYMSTGYYTCISGGLAKNETRYIYVKDPLKEELLALEDELEVTVDEGGTVVLPCRPTDPDLTVSLLKDGLNLEPSENTDLLYDKHLGFTVKNVISGGEYSCEAKTQKTSVSKWITLKVIPSSQYLGEPVVRQQPPTVVRGLNVTLNCSCEFEQRATTLTQWSLPNNSTVQNFPDKGHIVQYDATQKNNDVNKESIRKLIIYNVSSSDEGEYTCTVRDNARNIESTTHFLRVYDGPILEVTIKNYENETSPKIKTVTGQFMQEITADIISYPEPKISWFDNNGKEISEGQNHPYTMTKGWSKTTLKIQDLQSNVGIYSLVVNNEGRKTVKNITLQYDGPPVVKVVGRVDGLYLLGKTHIIDCLVMSITKPKTLDWYFIPCSDPLTCEEKEKIQVIETEEVKEDVSRQEFKFTLNYQSNRTGHLKCEACNDRDCEADSTPFITTDIEGGFGIIANTEVVVVNDNITLTCKASKNKYKKEISWSYSDNYPIALTSAIKGFNNETRYSYLSQIVIPTVLTNNNNTYICFAVDKMNESHQEQYLMKVQTPIRPTINKSVDTEWKVNTSEKVTLQCRTSGIPPPKIKWLKDGKQFFGNPSNTVLSDGNQTLIITIGLQDGGTYHCMAENKFGRDRLKFSVVVKDKMNKSWFYAASIVMLVMFLVSVSIALFNAKRVFSLRKELKDAGLYHFFEGDFKFLNPDLELWEQPDLLPFDRDKWEFPREKLQLGKQLGSGAFGKVLKGKASDILKPGVTTTVAVKMVKNQADSSSIKALSSELKIMIHLGEHINVVNVLGACINVHRRELLVLVEYCQHGNLHHYLLKHRGAFINQVNPLTGTFDSTLTQPTSPSPPSSEMLDDDVFSGESPSHPRTSTFVSTATEQTLLSCSSVTSSASPDQSTPIGEDGYVVSRNKDEERPVCTQDLLSWAFQIARGMEYLASRKLLHGDLAARNILLADNNVTKICDFGLAKNIGKDDYYRKLGSGLLPFKWMAVESIRDRVFTTQSDVWSYGVTLWELFSLAQTPYAGFQDYEKLFKELEWGYRLEQPKYATANIYKVMNECWDANPKARPSFSELAERMGNMLEETVKLHYLDLNEIPEENTELLAQQDYLMMLRSPAYANWSSPSPATEQHYSTMRALKKASEPSPESVPMLTATDNYNKNVTQVAVYNPSYDLMGQKNIGDYIVMEINPQNSCAVDA